MRPLMALTMGLVLALACQHVAAQPAGQPARPPQAPGGPPGSFPGGQPPGAIDYRELVPVLIDALKDPDGEVRQSAAGALAGMGGLALNPLLDVVKDPKQDKDLRANAAYVIGLMGGGGRAALPTLTKLLKDDDVQVRKRAIFAIGRIVKESGPGMGMAGFGLGGLGGFPGSAPGGAAEKAGPGVDPGVVLPSGKPSAKPDTDKKETKKEEEQKP
jgi:HEAT repeats/HEAT repeat